MFTVNYGVGAWQMKITGLEQLSKSLKELERAVADLDGNIGNIQFDPHDPESIELAVQSAHRAIDEKLAPYARNEMVAGLANDLKENVRATILERAAAARLEDGDE